MGLARYACCTAAIGDPHEPRCGGSERYPRGRERESAERYAREIFDRSALRSHAPR